MTEKAQKVLWRGRRGHISYRLILTNTGWRRFQVMVEGRWENIADSVELLKDSVPVLEEALGSWFEEMRKAA